MFLLVTSSFFCFDSSMAFGFEIAI
jgi:hypothetical protein